MPEDMYFLSSAYYTMSHHIHPGALTWRHNIKLQNCRCKIAEKSLISFGKLVDWKPSGTYSESLLTDVPHDNLTLIPKQYLFLWCHMESNDFIGIDCKDWIWIF